MGIQDVEEGEISDSASVEEISEEDFNKQELKATKEEEAKAKPESRVWTMQDVYKYQYKSGYNAGLYNLAWAQAVQNRPLNEVFDLEAQKEDNSNSKRSSSAPSVNSNDDKNNAVTGGNRVLIDVTGDEVDAMVVDVEKEEGELEEGEIDLDWEPATKAAGEGGEDNFSDGSVEIELHRALESIISCDSSISFEGLCTKLEHSLEGLCKLVSVHRVPVKDSLVELFFAAVQALHSAFRSMDYLKKELNKEIWKRILSLVVRNGPSFLPSKQLKEIEDMECSLGPLILSLKGSSNKEKDAQFVDGSSGGSSAEAVGPKNQATASESLKQGFKGRGILIPLLDLHKDHDADSLPSPTQQAPPALALPRALSSADGMFKNEFGSRKLANGTEDFRMHPYETEALKALSSYQQKFGRSSSFTSDRLPSPTPSEEAACGADDVGGEVSSFATGNSNPTVLGRSLAPSSPHIVNANTQAVNSARSVPASSVPNFPAKSSSKSRDPRLRAANTDSGSMDLTHQEPSSLKNSPGIDTFSGIMSSRKQRNIEDLTIGGSEPKRPRNELGNPGVTLDMRTSSGGGGFFEGTAASGWQTLNRGLMAEIASDPRKIDNRIALPVNNIDKTNVTVNGTDPLRLPSTSTAFSLPELLKGIAVNPTTLVNLLKMGQQHMFVSEAPPADAPRTTSIPFSSSSMLGVTPPVSTAPVAPGSFQKPAGTPQVPAQTNSM
ncbi:hypothetical protein CRG98_008195, partial [Punica granatum]